MMKKTRRQPFYKESRAPEHDDDSNVENLHLCPNLVFTNTIYHRFFVDFHSTNVEKESNLHFKSLLCNRKQAKLVAK
jgi:hypothetical protein